MTSRVVLPGIALGALALALLAALGIGLPQATGEAGASTATSSSSEPITLPDTLPGGFTAVDLEEAFAGMGEEYADQIGASVRNEQAAREYGDKVLNATGVASATRTYVASPESDDGQVLILQAFRAAGGAFAPFQLSDPSNAEAGASVNTLVTQGDVTCIETGSADGSGGVQANYVECQKSSDDFTIQVTTQLALDDAVALVETVWTAIA